MNTKTPECLESDEYNEYYLLFVFVFIKLSSGSDDVVLVLLLMLQSAEKKLMK